MIDVKDILLLIEAGQILWTEHLSVKLRERSIKRADVIACIQNGDIIEQYPDDFPLPSCLILGYSVAEQPLHVVCGLNLGDSVFVITAYYPSLDTWEEDFRTRKKVD